MIDLSIGMWVGASSTRKRIYTIVAVFIVAVLVTIVGSFVPVSASDAEQINKDLNQTVTTMQAQGSLVQYIFGNNFLITLVMFIPVIGPVLGLFIMFNTGNVVGAIATSGGYSPIIALIALVITPVFWLEFAAYSTAMAESVWLFRRLLQGRGLRELRNMTIFVTITAVILALSAVIETALISIGL
jgi:Stage II sporulation protein M